MKNQFLIFSLLLFFHFNAYSQKKEAVDSIGRIQVCLLLDVSGSMDGLLLQAQSQVWKMINHLAKFQKYERASHVELAVLSYGHNAYVETGHIKIVSPFTSTLDSLAEGLFQLETGGGNEYCGEALQTALDSLNWKKDSSAYQALFIAGNETFEQGSLDFRAVCEYATQRGVLVNTIYCGDKKEGKDHFWEEAAVLGEGDYLNINQDIDIADYQTPYDNKIIDLYRSYRKTLILEEDSKKKGNFMSNHQYRQDGTVNPVYRDMVIYKVRHEEKKEDVVEIFEQNNWNIRKIDKNQLPPNLRNLPELELKKYLFRKSQEREITRKAIERISEKMEEYLDIKMGSEGRDYSLDEALHIILTIQLEDAGFKQMADPY